jgi:hypothetical protein
VLMRTALARGRAARRFDAFRNEAPSRTRELVTLARCAGHVVLRRCPAGMTMVAHSYGRLQEALRPRRRAGRPETPSLREDFLSGESGTVGGRGRAWRRLLDAVEDGVEHASARRTRLRRAAHSFPERRRVLVVGVQRPERASLANAARVEIERSRHDVEMSFGAAAGRGKFENVNALIAEHSLEGRDWLVVLDDDVVLPRGFLDNVLFLAERFSLDLAQPAHRRTSHAAWQVTRRRLRSVVRETRFVEIGPVTVLGRATFGTLLPFPASRMGWGLDAHWAALAREHAWRCGVLDAVSIQHGAAPVAHAYSRVAAVAEAQEFLAGRPYLPASELQRTLVTHRRW